MSGEERDLQWESLVSAVARSIDPTAIVRCYLELGSTMDLARELSEGNGDARSIVVLAKKQSHGRGRQGRSWSAPPGALNLTIVWRLTRPIHLLTGLSLVIGARIARWGRELGAPFLVKWPNDIVTAQGQKAAGILIEVLRGGAGTLVSVGIGMNLMQPPPDVSHSVSLAALTGSVLSPPEVVVSLLPALSDAIQQFDSAGFQPFRSEWLQMAAYRGERMVVDLGGELVRGVFTSISSEGCLQIDTGAGVRDITAGHIVSIGADDGSGTYRNRAATDCE